MRPAVRVRSGPVATGSGEPSSLPSQTWHEAQAYPWNPASREPCSVPSVGSATAAAGGSASVGQFAVGLGERLHAARPRPRRRPACGSVYRGQRKPGDALADRRARGAPGELLVRVGQPRRPQERQSPAGTPRRACCRSPRSAAAGRCRAGGTARSRRARAAAAARRTATGASPSRRPCGT